MWHRFPFCTIEKNYKQISKFIFVFFLKLSGGIVKHNVSMCQRHCDANCIFSLTSFTCYFHPDFKATSSKLASWEVDHSYLCLLYYSYSIIMFVDNHLNLSEVKQCGLIFPRQLIICQIQHSSFFNLDN